MARAVSVGIGVVVLNCGCGPFDIRLWGYRGRLALRPAVFAAFVFATNCLPCLDPAIFLRFVAAFWAGLSLFQAASGR